MGGQWGPMWLKVGGSGCAVDEGVRAVDDGAQMCKGWSKGGGDLRGISDGRLVAHSQGRLVPEAAGMVQYQHRCVHRIM